MENKIKTGRFLWKLLEARSCLPVALWITEDKPKQFPRLSHTADLRDGFLTVLSPGEAVPKLGISKFMEPSCSSHTEIAPDILIAAEIQLLNRARAGLKSLQRQTDRKSERKSE